MKIVEINREELNNFIAKEKHSQFLQSWEWGEFQEKMGSKIYRLGIIDNGEILGLGTLIKKALPFGKCYFYCPRGPVTLNVEHITHNEVMDKIFLEIKNISEKENCIFLRLESQFKIQNSKFKISQTIDVQPSKTLILDLDKTEEELLKNMHQKTRYNIRLAKKKGVKIREGSLEDFEKFWQIMEETKERDKFGLHNKDYYKKMIEINSIKLFLAYYQNKVIAGNIISFFGDTVTYVHGASSNEFRNVMAPYLLQWEVIKFARNKGYKYYDFYGIDEKKWPGVTRFKKGFSDNIIEYLGTFDLAYSKLWYNVYKVIRKLRRSL